MSRASQSTSSANARFRFLLAAIREAIVFGDRDDALGSLALLGGREGIGKSQIATTIAADITRGRLPGVNKGIPKSVVIAATEDAWEFTIVPRLAAAGADLDRVLRIEVQLVEGLTVPLVLPTDVEELRSVIVAEDVAMVALDPLISRLDAKLDSHKDGEVRIALEPLTAMFSETGCTGLGLIHVNKSGGSDPLSMLMASRAFPAVARAVFFAMRDGEDGGLFHLGQPKNNLGRSDLPTLNYRIEEVVVAETNEGPIVTSKVIWAGESDRTVTELLERAGETDDERSATDEAGDWLEAFLHSRGGCAARNDILAAGAKEHYSKDQIDRAKRRRKIGHFGRGFPRVTFWKLPGVTVEDEDAQSSRARGDRATTATTATTEGHSRSNTNPQVTAIHSRYSSYSSNPPRGATTGDQ